MSKIAAIIGRALLAILFIVSGITKLMDVGVTEGMIVGAGLPSGFAIPVGVFELAAGLCLAAGFMVRLVSILLAVFVAATILFFHNRFTDPVQGFAALKNLAIIGGLFLAFAHSHMWSHYYVIRTERRSERVTRDAEQRIHEAELRAARAEAVVEATRGTTATGAHGYTDLDHDGIPDGTVRRRRWFDW